MKALIGFGKMKDDELLTIATTIIGAMTGNAHFTTPMPALTDVQEALDDFSVKLAAARKRGSPEDTALKDESRVPLIGALQKLGYYVNGVAAGQLSVLLSSGFPTNSPAVGNLVPLRVDAVRLSDSRQTGQMRLDFAKQNKVLLYEYMYRAQTVPESEWSERFTTSSSRGNIIAPLEEGVRYEVRVRAVNSQGTGDWSQVAVWLVR